MVLGCYYITSFDREGLPRVRGIGIGFGFGFGEAEADADDALFRQRQGGMGAFTNGRVTLHTPLWVRFAGLFESHTNSEEPLEVRLHSNGRCLSIRSEVQQMTARSGTHRLPVGRYIRTTAGRILMHEITSPKVTVVHPASTVSAPRKWVSVLDRNEPEALRPGYGRPGDRPSSTIREKHPSWKAEIEEGNQGSRPRRKKGGLASPRGRKKGSQQRKGIR